MWIRVTLTLLHLWLRRKVWSRCTPVLQEPSNKQFKEFHDFSISCGLPLPSVLISARKLRRKCGKALKVEEKRVHVVVFTIPKLGTYLGSRVIKNFRSCKVYEHYGFWTEDGVKHIDAGCLNNEFLLSSEDTAFHLSLIRQCASLLNVGAVPFSTLPHHTIGNSTIQRKAILK